MEALLSRHYGHSLFIHGIGSRVHTLESDLVEGGVVTGKPTTLGETKGRQQAREHQRTIQQTNHCIPLSSALGQPLQTRHAAAKQCGVGLLVSTSRKNLARIAVGCRISLRIMVRRTTPVGLVHMTDRRVTETKQARTGAAIIYYLNIYKTAYHPAAWVVSSPSRYGKLSSGITLYLRKHRMFHFTLCHQRHV